MGYKYGYEFAKAKVMHPHLSLCALATVYHIEFATDIDHLRGGEMLACRERRATAEYVYVKFHYKIVWERYRLVLKNCCIRWRASSEHKSLVRLQERGMMRGENV